MSGLGVVAAGVRASLRSASLILLCCQPLVVNLEFPLGYGDLHVASPMQGTSPHRTSGQESASNCPRVRLESHFADEEDQAITEGSWSR